MMTKPFLAEDTLLPVFYSKTRSVTQHIHKLSLLRPKRKAYMLIEVLQWLLLVGIVSSAGFAIVNRALVVQHRSSNWLAEDTQLRHVLNRLCQDVSTASGAEIDGVKSPTLTLRRPGRQVRYQQRDGAIVRMENDTSGELIEHTWELARCSLKWSIEKPLGGSTLVWTGITQSVRPEEGPNAIVYRYATAVRVGSESATEELR